MQWGCKPVAGSLTLATSGAKYPVNEYFRYLPHLDDLYIFMSTIDLLRSTGVSTIEFQCFPSTTRDDDSPHHWKRTQALRETAASDRYRKVAGSQHYQTTNTKSYIFIDVISTHTFMLYLH
jgi:hypothetical protein